MAELVEHVDDDDQVIGVIDRDEAVRRHLLHRIAAVVCRDDEDRILVHRRAEGLSRYGGYYDTVIGGAVDVGESYEDAARRELAEEFGVRLERPPALVFKARFQDDHGPYWMALHDARLSPTDSASIKPDETEVA